MNIQLYNREYQEKSITKYRFPLTISL